MPDLTDEDIAFIQDLREKHEDGKVNRRQALGMLGAAGVGAAGGFLGTGSAAADPSTSDSDGNVGLPSDRVDVFAEGIDSNSVSANTGTIDSLDGTDLQYESVNAKELKGDYPGDVRAVSGGSVVASIDPPNSTTPIQDAIDAIDAATGEGTIYIPDDIDESGKLTSVGGKSFIGADSSFAKVNFTDTSVWGVEFDGNTDVYIDRINFNGTDPNRGNGAFHFINNSSKSVNIGRVKFTNWSGPVIHFDTSHAFSSTWAHVYMFPGSNNGPGFQSDNGGPGLSIANYYGGPGNGAKCILINGGGGVFDFGTINIGGDGGRAVDISTPASVDIDNINYETGNAPTDVVRAAANGKVHVGQIQITNSTPAYAMSFRKGDVALGSAESGSTATVRVESANIGKHIFGGSASGVDNQAGVLLDKPGILCQADGVRKFSTGIGYDGGIDDAKTNNAATISERGYHDFGLVTAGSLAFTTISFAEAYSTPPVVHTSKGSTDAGQVSLGSLDATADAITTTDFRLIAENASGQDRNLDRVAYMVWRV